MKISETIFILLFVFSANLYADSSIEDEELLGVSGELYCVNTKYLECLGVNTAKCKGAYIKAARACIAKHPLVVNMDRKPTTMETKKYGDCTASEISADLSKHESCSAHLESTFDKMRKDARTILENSNSSSD